MTQEQKEAIKLAAQTKYPSKGHETAVKKLHFSWGCTHVVSHAAQFGLIDSIKADTVLHIGLAQLQEENTRLREAMEAIKSMCDANEPAHEKFWRIAFNATKEALKQEEE